MEPEGQSYDLEVKLSQASAEAAALAPELETWTVEPTMVRGQKRKASQGQGTSFRQRVARKQGKQAKKANPTAAKQPAPSAAELEPQTLVLSPDDFKRTAAGKAKIKECVQAVNALDYELHPRSRMFDALGVCRLKNCPRITLTECIELAPEYFDIRFLDLCRDV